MCDANGNPTLNAKDEKITEEKLIFGFAVATIKILRFLKEIVAETPALHVKIDGTHLLNSSG